MASILIRLDTLPTEIVHRIASETSCETVFSLMKVNRRLHQTCYDNVTFKAIIKNGSGYEVSQPWDCELISNPMTPTTTLARLALADSCARSWLAITTAVHAKSENMIHYTKPSVPVSEWAPALVAMKHPFFMELKHFEKVFHELECLGRPDLNFWFTAIVLYHVTAAPPQSSARNKSLMDCLRLQLVDWESHSYPSLLAASLCYRSTLGLRDVPLPCPPKMPLWELMGDPLPFSKDVLIGLGASHLQIMTSMPFVENGEWVGYYSDSVDLFAARWDPAMTGICFTANPEAGRFALRATGTDSIGNFELDGTVASDGEVIMRKSYINEHHWDWNASMTPFGIVGTWGLGTQPYGLCWLWKREWSLA